MTLTFDSQKHRFQSDGFKVISCTLCELFWDFLDFSEIFYKVLFLKCEKNSKSYSVTFNFGGIFFISHTHQRHNDAKLASQWCQFSVTMMSDLPERRTSGNTRKKKLQLCYSMTENSLCRTILIRTEKKNHTGMTLTVCVGVINGVTSRLTYWYHLNKLVRPWCSDPALCGFIRESGACSSNHWENAPQNW